MIIIKRFTLFFLAFLFLENGFAQMLDKGNGKRQSENNQNNNSNAPDKPGKVMLDTIYKDPSTKTWMRKVEYDNGAVSIMMLPPPIGERTPINMDTINKDSVVIVVEKEYNVIYVLYKRKRIRQYRAVFGPDKMRDKHREGDRCTPEGWFKILEIRNHKEWQKFMLLDYPTPESYERFNARKKNGEIPSNARIGAAIGIHGTFKGGDNMVDQGFGWTDGCVALKSSDIYDFSKFVKEGTRVYITKKSKAVQRKK